MNGKESLIETLPSLLEWQSGVDLVRSACKSHLSWLHHRLKTWSDFSHSDLYACVARMPLSSQQRLLLAPYLFYMLQTTITPGAEEIAKVRRFIRAEELVFENAEPETSNGAGWTALGDRYFGGHDEAGAAGLDTATVPSGYQAPRIRHIVIDARSPFHRLRVPEAWGETASHTEAEIAVVLDHIVQELDYINEVSPTASAMVGASLQVIAGVNTPALPGLTSGMSLRQMIGRMVVTNGHSSAWIPGKLANALVHEAIHSLIYKLELAVPLYTDDAAAWRLQAVSPWSGRTLYLHSFVHACFVWYGLWRFWTIGCDVSPLPSHVGFRDQAHKGFLNGSPLSGLSPEAYETIAPYVRSTIDRIYSTVGAGH